MKNIIKRILPICIQNYLAKVKNSYLDGYAQKSYSQEGEDMILRYMFESNASGFYVDVGAHHPRRFSNTYYFYKKGWIGINIDAMPGSMSAFKKERPRDINIEASISAAPNTMTYYVFNEPALNGFDARLSQDREARNSQYRIIDKIEMQTRRLGEILDVYMPKYQNINFLSIDVEGLDFEVLRSNDWSKYKPEVILVEVLGSTFSTIANNEISRFLSEYNYVLFAKTVKTVIYKRILQ